MGLKMDDSVNELEKYLVKLDELKSQSDYLLAELKRAESAGEFEKCRICSRQWAVTRKAVCFINRHIDNLIMLRLPPLEKQLSGELG